MSRMEEEIKARTHPAFWAYKCSCFATLMVLLLPLTIFLNVDPSFSIDNFYVPALNKFINPISIPNTTAEHNSSIIFFHLEIQNEMKNKGVCYDAVNLIFSYGTNTTGSNMTIGSYTVAGFYQGWKKKAQRRGVAAVTCSLPWEAEAMRALAGGSKAEFRVDIVARMKFKAPLLWCMAKKTVKVGGVVEVDDSGKKAGKKPVKFETGFDALKLVLGLLGLVYIVVAVVLSIMAGVAAIKYCLSHYYPNFPN